LDLAAPAHPFADLGLSEAALAAVTAAGYLEPTPVQRQAIAPALAGRDVIAIAATGTGKTAAFVLPMLDRLLARPVAGSGAKGVRALVLAPTRELAQQIADAVRTFGAARGVKCAHVVGGVGFDQQIQALRGGREVLVATPGRLIDHLEQRTARLDGVEIVVLDEADRMLDMGFLPQITRVLAAVPAERQTMLFSATMGDEVERFSRRCLRDPVRVQTARSGTVAARAEQRVFHVAQQGKLPLLLALLGEAPTSTLVFTRTKHRAEKVAKALQRAGHRVARIHGDRSQSQRNMALDGFRSGDVRVLVATDVAARGLDVEEIAHVVNFDLSLVPDDHVHRVGRTARASATGVASSFCSPEEVPLLRQIEKFTRSSIAHSPVPDGVAAADVPAAAPAPAEARAEQPAPTGQPPRQRPPRPFRPPEDRAQDRRRPFGQGGGRATEWKPREWRPQPQRPSHERQSHERPSREQPSQERPRQDGARGGWPRRPGGPQRYGPGRPGGRSR
jgi:ATP-dependent RNA helicase RhlE